MRIGDFASLALLRERNRCRAWLVSQVRRVHRYGPRPIIGLVLVLATRADEYGEIVGDPSALAEITVIAKNDGPLTKRISLVGNEQLATEGSACTTSRGGARRWRGDVCEFAALLEQLGSNQAITLGSLRPGLADKVEIMTKRKLNDADQPNLIARSQDYLSYRSGEPALGLIDFDQKGMPADVAERLAQHGGLSPSLCAVLPQIGTAARVVRRSTSAGLYRADTSEPLPGSGGEHIFVSVPDGSDIERFSRTLHDRCFRHGFGWHLVGSAGQLVKRSIVNRVVGSPERLVFDGPSVLDPPLVQDKPVSLVVAVDDDAPDAVIACPPLRILELAIIRERQAKLRHQLKTVRDQSRRLVVTQQIERLAARTGMALGQARQIVERQYAGILLLALAVPAGDRLLGTRGATP